jgi:hypothetical protein
VPDGSKGRCKTKRSPWSSRLGVGLLANDSTPKNLLSGNLQRPMEEVHGGGQDVYRVVAPLEKKELLVLNIQ